MLTRDREAEPEREAERRVRAACRAGASPGGMGERLPRQRGMPQPGLQSITNNHRQPVDRAIHRP